METARLLEGRSATSKKVLQVCDNLNMHAKGAFYEAFEPQWAGAGSNSTTRPGTAVG